MTSVHMYTVKGQRMWAKCQRKVGATKLREKGKGRQHALVRKFVGRATGVCYGRVLFELGPYPPPSRTFVAFAKAQPSDCVDLVDSVVEGRQLVEGDC